MRFEVIPDAEGYIQIIRHTGTPRDFLELNLEDYDFSTPEKRACYKLQNGGLIFDEEKYNGIINDEKKASDLRDIDTLQQKLNETDYILVKELEEITTSLRSPLTFVADIIKILIKYSDEYGEIIKNRIRWRQKIKDLKEKYK